MDCNGDVDKLLGKIMEKVLSPSRWIWYSINFQIRIIEKNCKEKGTVFNYLSLSLSISWRKLIVELIVSSLFVAKRL